MAKKQPIPEPEIIVASPRKQREISLYKRINREAKLRKTGDASRGQIEVRYDEREKINIDEVCAKNCFVHLERMDRGEWALMIYAEREIGCYWITSRNGKAYVVTTENWKDKQPRTLTEAASREEWD